ncbi:AAA family ATPase [Companilactobacillus furfuricola]|uniref:AAA family ATPase n=1 Tax=Companilactobacillus furfuricola TaxID=1462575 RepID=UPI000F7AF64A|nr:SMC family ATPase [Companilactobacillus furfuricola]
MKPIYLEMKYFGPHESSTIDFRELDDAPIFLIGGDTGAGKSTIFDAMTFALFGQTTGDRKPTELRSQFAPNDQKTEVTFYFEQGNQLYRIIRTPEQMLAKKRGNGLTSNKSSAKLAIVDHVGGSEISSIAAKPADVGTEIDSILNLTAEQFKKIILLPQNDFSEFLKSKTNEKEPILKKIFDTQLFTDFTNQLTNSYVKAKKQGEGFETKLQMQLDSNVWTPEEREQLAPEANQQKMVLLSDFVEKRKNNLNALTKERTKVYDSVDKANKSLQEAKDLEKKFTDLAKYQNEFQANVTNKTDSIKQAQDHLLQLQWAKPLQEPIRDLNAKQIELTSSKKVQVELESAVKSAQQLHDKVKTSSEKLTSQKTDFDNKDKRIQELSVIIPKITNVEQIQKKISALTPQLKTIQTEFADKQKAVDILTTNIANDKQKQVSTTELQNKRNQLTAEKETFFNTLTPLKSEKNSATANLKQSKNELDLAKKKLASDEAELKEARETYDQQIHRRSDLMIAQLQQDLEDGKPCVVCGSTDHSHMEVKVKADEAELKKAMDQVDQAQNNFASIQNSVSADEKNIKKIQADVTDKTKLEQSIKDQCLESFQKLTDRSALDFTGCKQLDDFNQIFDEQIKQMDVQLKQASDLDAKIKAQQEKLEKAQEEATSFNLQLSSKQSELKSHKSDLKERSKDLDLAKPSSELSSEKNNLESALKQYQTDLKDVDEKLHQSNLSLSNNQTKLDDTTQRIKQQSQTISDLEETIQTKLSAKDAKTSDENVLNNWITEINQDQISTIQVSISNYQNEKKRLEKEIKQLQTELVDAKHPDLEALQTDLANKNQQKDAIIEKVSYANKDLEDAKSNLTSIKTIMKEQGTFAQKFSEITSLYNIVTGKDGNDNKLKLETYVVQNYLQRVLNYANDHFINLLSNNRYSFELSTQGSDNRTDHGLDINVFDNETGDVRSSNTLSGGETFIAALSIALSLSEVVQSSSNGVQIDALFVDEGFGSLDHETLDKAMTALETIGENRMVGVISHIDSMKNTIGQQIYIKKLGDGRSTVKMISK